ncbi:hypothetical protein [Bacillus pumilus]|uniref:hypothetical protein n=1 Tax=Bacillus pumilus TaxID=1408 RepID=UPI0022804954|nr:hypothetical protein [Bacillus pumilus]MCY7540849.1 hypothetical protein [Bacillus pumilus]MEC3592133.1 hypothetical protein [Bacillus pumilus]
MNHIKACFFLLLCITLLSGCNTENTTSKVKETKQIESGENNKVSEVKEAKKPFDFKIDEFVKSYNKTALAFKSGEEEVNVQQIKEIGDFELTEIASGHIYTKELLNEIDDSDGTFSLQAWHDHDKNFYRLHISTTGSENIASEQGALHTIAVLKTLDVDIKHLNDFLDSEKDSLNVIDGDYSVQFTKIPGMSLILNIEPK